MSVTREQYLIMRKAEHEAALKRLLSQHATEHAKLEAADTRLRQCLTLCEACMVAYDSARTQLAFRDWGAAIATLDEIVKEQTAAHDRCLNLVRSIDAIREVLAIE